jgi:hypothetical protein
MREAQGESIMNSRIAVLFFVFTLFSQCIFAQQSGISQKQLDTIKSALQRIAISNNAVENIIYDGMTYQEVMKILNVEALSITTDFNQDHALIYPSFVGKYLIFWSGLAHSNPIVIGYSVRGSKTIKHNTLE